MSLTEIIQIITGFIGSLGFAVLFNIRGKRSIAAAFGGFLSWTLFVFLNLFIHNDPVNYFLVALAVSIYAEVMARVMKTPKQRVTESVCRCFSVGNLDFMARNF